MTTKAFQSLFILAILLLSTSPAIADDLTPSGNLVGIKKVQEKVTVSLNLKGAEEFRIDPNEVRKLIQSAISAVGVETNGSGLGVPMVDVLIDGESTGSGGARYSVEVFVQVSIPSPFAKNRSVQAIIWRGVESSQEISRYDPELKGIINPSGSIDERVYSTVREVASHLAADFKKTIGGN